MPDTGVLLEIGADNLGNGIVFGSTDNFSEVYLFVNNHTPAWGDDIGDFTNCSLTGGGPQSIVAADWVESAVGSSKRFTYPTLTYTFAAYGGAPVTIYGYFLTNTNGDALMAVKFSNPYTVPNAGGGGTLDLFFDVKNA